MFWITRYLRRKLDPYMTVERAERSVNALRVAYFFSASTFLFLVVGKIKEIYGKEKVESIKAKTETVDKEMLLLMGRPVIEDIDEVELTEKSSSEFKMLRLQGRDKYTLIQYGKDKGLVKKEYNREEYLKQLEEEALNRAREAQRKALAEGKELPEGAIKLV